jgi:DNA adenine methylase
MEARPFIKWVGGKTQLLGQLTAILPDRIRTYYEPFVGGGALFFALANQKRFKRAVLNDWNSELIDLYKSIRDFPDELLGALQKLKADYQQDAQTTYYRERQRDAKALTPLDRAARFMFLNKTGFNGLYRVNKSGGFNVPMGKYTNPKIVDEENLRACSQVLNRFLVLTSKDFSEVIKEAQPGDAVYFDPPYVPVTATSNFTSYTSDGFTLDDQYRLVAGFKQLVESGVAVVASNSDTPLVRDLYAGFEIHCVQARRNINSKGDKRGAVGELVIVGRQGPVLSASIPSSPKLVRDYDDELEDSASSSSPSSEKSSP